MIAIYVRQSIDKKDSISIETQIDFCKGEIKNKEAFKVFQDKGFSGKNISRPAFGELLKDIKDKKISRIIVYKLDRISRSITDFANIVDLLEEYEVSFTSVNEKFDTSTPVGRAMLYIIIIFAQMERETIAERIKDNYYARGKTGVWLGGPAPLGFDNVKSKLNGKTVSTIKVNDDIEIVKKIFDLYANTNMSLGGIAKELRKEYDFMFNNIKLSRILHNPAYVRADADIYAYYKTKKCIMVNEIEEFQGVKGCNLFGKRDRGKNKYNLTKDHVLALSMHDGIIDSDTFLVCQQKLKSNRQIKNTGKGKHTWLTGLVKCGYCGYSMSARVYKDKKYLYCRGRSVTDTCIKEFPTYYVEDIEEEVLNEIMIFAQKLKSVDIAKSQSKVPDTQTNDLKIELYNLDTEIDKLINAISSANDVLIDYINKKVVELDNRKTEILQTLSTKEERRKFELPDLDNLRASDMETKREIASSLINRINVFENELKIDWKY